MGIISGVKECLLGIYERIVIYLYGPPPLPKKQIELPLIKEEDASLYTFGVKDLESNCSGSVIGHRHSIPKTLEKKKTKSLKDEIEEEEDSKRECPSPLSLLSLKASQKNVRFVNALTRKNSTSKRSFFSISGSSQRNGTLKSNKSMDFLTARSSFSDHSDSGLPGFENKEIVMIDQPSVSAKLSYSKHLRKWLKSDPKCVTIEYEISDLSSEINIMEIKNINAGRKYIELFLDENQNSPRKYEKIYENETLESKVFMRKDNAITFENIYYLYCSWTSLRRRGRAPADNRNELENLISFINKRSLLLSDNDINNEIYLVEDPNMEQPYLILINHNKNIFANNPSSFLHVQSFGSEEESPIDERIQHLGKYIGNLIQINFSLNFEELEETLKAKQREMETALNTKGHYNNIYWIDQYEEGYRIHSYCEISFFENLPPAIAKNKFSSFFKKFFCKELENLL